MAEKNFVVSKNIVADNVPEISETFISTNSAVTISSFDKEEWDGAEYVVKIKQSDGFTSTKVLVAHDGSQASKVQYGKIFFERSAVSAAPSTWTTRASNLESGLPSTADYGNGLWLAAVNAGEGAGTLIKSTDRITWVTQSSNFSASIKDVAYGNSLWVGVGIFGEIHTSTDAITWTTRTSNFGSTNISSVAYGDNLWVAVGESGQIRASTDGTTWVTRTSNVSEEGGTIKSVVYGNGLWVAAGNSGILRTSTDTVTWSTPEGGVDGAGINAAAYGNGRWVVAGYGIFTSENGSVWTARTSNFGENVIRDVKYGDGFWIAVGGYGVIRTSTDAITWTTQANTGSVAARAIANNSSDWVIVAGGEGAPIIYTSETVSSPQQEIPVSFSADISGSDVILQATVTDGDQVSASVTTFTTVF